MKDLLKRFDEFLVFYVVFYKSGLLSSRLIEMKQALK